MTDADIVEAALESAKEGLDLSRTYCDECPYLYKERGDRTTPGSRTCEGSVRECPRIEFALDAIFDTPKVDIKAARKAVKWLREVA